MNSSSDVVRLPWREEFVAPVTILDAEGRLVRIVSATEFRRLYSTSPDSVQSRGAEGRDRQRRFELAKVGVREE